MEGGGTVAVNKNSCGDRPEIGFDLRFDDVIEFIPSYANSDATRFMSSFRVRRLRPDDSNTMVRKRRMQTGQLVLGHMASDTILRCDTACGDRSAPALFGWRRCGVALEAG